MINTTNINVGDLVKINLPFFYKSKFTLQRDSKFQIGIVISYNKFNQSFTVLCEDSKIKHEYFESLIKINM